MLFVHENTGFLDLERHFVADILQRIHRRHREVTFFRSNFVSEIWKFFARAVPMALTAVDNVRRRVAAVCKSHIVENEELRFRSEECSIRDAGAFQVGLGLFRDAARVAIVWFARNWIDYRADERKRWFEVEDVDPRRRGIRNDEHVRGVNDFPAADTRAVEPEAVSKNIVAISLRVVVKCCHVPGRSVNLKSTSFTS